MERFLASLILIFALVEGKGQNTFHKLVYFDFPHVRFTAVLPTDSCFYISATFVDTISPLRTGTMFVKFDLYGEFLLATTIKNVNKLYFTDYGDLINDGKGGFIRFGDVGDSIAKAILLNYSASGDTILTKEYFSILYPELSYLVSKQVKLKPDRGMAVLIGHESIYNEDFDISLLVLDSSYNIVHYVGYENAALQEGSSSLVLDTDGGYVIGGSRNNLNQTNTNFLYRTYIFKTDNLGAVEWEYLSPSGVLQDEAKAMIKTADGGLVVASGKGMEDPVHPTIHLINWDALIFKLDSSQNVVWSTPLRGVFPTTQTELTEMAASADGSGYVAVGKVADAVSGSEPMSGSWIVKVSPEGDSLWARYYTIFDGVDVDPNPYDLKQTPDGGYVIVGNTINLGQTAPGWIMKVDSYGCLVPGCQITDTEEAEESGLQLSLYPNPASNLLNVWYRSASGKGASFKLADAQGRVFRSFDTRLPDVTLVVPVRDCEAGVYFLQCFEEEELVRTEKFIVKR